MKELTIGKLPDNILVIDNRMVSRHHAKIVMDHGGRYELIDLGSKNGTYVNGRKVRGSQAVRSGDRIVFATTPIPSGWERLFDQIPDDEPKLAFNAQTTADGGLDSSILASVLYDFDKDVDALFAKEIKKLKQIITDFKENRLPSCRPIITKQFSEEVLDLLIERYDYVGKQISLLLGQLESESQSFQAEYTADMQKLDTTYQYYLRNSKGEADLTANLGCVDTRKGEMKQHYEDLCKAVLPLVNSIIEDYYTQNPPLFTNRFELAPADSQLWKTFPSPDDEIQKTFYLGEDVARYNILQQPVELRKRVYVQSLYGGNLLFKYSPKHRQTCFDTVNTLICRMLAATPGGKMQVVMVDTKEMEGTCGAFNGLNKDVFKVVSRSEDFNSMLNEELSHTENIIQNLLQGDITNIAEYNLTKSEKLPFTLWVLKDIPTGRGNDFSDKLSKILRNGPRAGVSVLVLLDEETNNTLTSAPLETCYFTSGSPAYKTSDTPQISFPEIFSTDIISTVIKNVNQALEVKTETILKYSEYMLPVKDWWKGESAKRVDLPFGISKEMKTTALQITQESGQNSAVVIGIPGSGKSVFLHTIIASAITHYSPKELQLYLLDFSGVEFDIYARHNLPHARVIAPEAEREFGLSILREVFEEGNRRMALCRENGVTNIVELKQHNPDVVVPRLLVIIDEFQKIFEVETDNISKEANAKIHAIIQEYRKFGINLILATQKLPAKSIVPYDMIANRVVFKSDPNDFNNLIKWSYSVPQPRLSTGACIYNNESGAEAANCQTQSYFINASQELENLLDEVSAFAENNPERLDQHELLTFRSNELPEFTSRIVASRHYEPQEIPREVGVYLGESIAIAPCHVHVPLTKDSNNNILIIGGDPIVAKSIAYYAMMSTISGHTEKSCNIKLMNFILEDDPMQGVFQTKMFAAAAQYCNLEEAKSADEVKNCLQAIKDDVIEVRKKDTSIPLTHYFINIFEFQRGRMFDGTGSRGDMQSECARLLEYILKNGPMVGVFTLLQVDNLTNLNRIGFGIPNLFCHRIALQMQEQDSDRIVGSAAANKLLVLNRPATKYRGLYYNNVNNSITKFKPYSL
jgi:adenylate kinase